MYHGLEAQRLHQWWAELLTAASLRVKVYLCEVHPVWKSQQFSCDIGCHLLSRWRFTVTAEVNSLMGVWWHIYPLWPNLDLDFHQNAHNVDRYRISTPYVRVFPHWAGLFIRSQISDIDHRTVCLKRYSPLKKHYYASYIKASTKHSWDNWRLNFNSADTVSEVKSDVLLSFLMLPRVILDITRLWAGFGPLREKPDCNPCM